MQTPTGQLTVLGHLSEPKWNQMTGKELPDARELTYFGDENGVVWCLDRNANTVAAAKVLGGDNHGE